MREKPITAHHSPMITISIFEYEYLTNHAALVEEIADKKVAAPKAWIEALKASEEEILMETKITQRELKKSKLEQELEVYTKEKMLSRRETRSAFIVAAASVPSYLLNRPVKITLDRDVDMMITGQRHSFLGKYKDTSSTLFVKVRANGSWTSEGQAEGSNSSSDGMGSAKEKLVIIPIVLIVVVLIVLLSLLLLLVYEFMKNGSLDKWIFPSYEDENFCPKVSDFGLAKLMGREHSHVVTMVRGTRGYLAPEWVSNHPITVKADVYNYGMLLLEIIGGRRNLDMSFGAEDFFYPGSAYKICLSPSETHPIVVVRLRERFPTDFRREEKEKSDFRQKDKEKKDGKDVAAKCKVSWLLFSIVIFPVNPDKILQLLLLYEFDHLVC
ncbi:hypothetical protein JHK82_027764 [Glycine max]|nr:hypothetical protein JHK82_027764 [Glycine max]